MPVSKKTNASAVPNSIGVGPETKKQPETPLQQRINSKRRRNLKRLLTDIYNETDRKTNSPTLPRRKNKFLWLSLLFFVFLIAVSWAGFFVFNRSQTFSDDNIEIKINCPEKARAGEIVVYRLYYANKQRIDLARVSLDVRYPDNFKFISAAPAPAGKKNQQWDIGAVSKHKNGLIEITGQIFGPAGSDQTLRVFFNYQPANFNSEFQKIAAFTIHLEPLPLELVLTGPKKTTVGEEIVYRLAFTNKNEEPLNDLQIAFSWPETFQVKSTEPSPSQDKNIWKIPSLAPQSSSTVKIIGVFIADGPSGDKTLTANFFLRGADEPFWQNSVSQTIVVNQAALSLEMTANGAADKQNVSFGDKISFIVSYENTGETVLKNVTLQAILDTPSENEKSLLNWNKLEDKAEGLVKGEQRSSAVRRGIIAWNKSQIPALAEIKPGGKGKIEFSIPVKTKTDLAAAKLSEYKIAAFAAATFNSSANQSTVVQSNVLNLILNTDLNLTVQATYKEKKNLPLAVGQTVYETETVYAVTWTLTNSLHEVTDLRLTAALPENAEWKNQTSLSAGEISFDQTLKQAGWQLNRLPVSVAKAVISFEIGIKSKESDRGKDGVIVEKTRVEAKDKITNENILFWKEAIATIL